MHKTTSRSWEATAEGPKGPGPPSQLTFEGQRGYHVLYQCRRVGQGVARPWTSGFAMENIAGLSKNSRTVDQRPWR